jgi:hypothetical protein
MGMSLNEEDKRFFIGLWMGLCVFASLFFLTGAIVKSIVAALFGVMSVVTGIGSYRVMTQFSVTISVLAIAVSFGLPSPERWPDLLDHGIHAATQYVSMSRNP